MIKHLRVSVRLNAFLKQRLLGLLFNLYVIPPLLLLEDLGDMMQCSLFEGSLILFLFALLLEALLMFALTLLALLLPELAIMTTNALNQVVMRALLHNGSMLQHNDDVTVADCGETMSNH